MKLRPRDPPGFQVLPPPSDAEILAEVGTVATFPGFTSEERLRRLRELLGTAPAPQRYTKAYYRQELVKRDAEIDQAVDCLTDTDMGDRRRVVAALFYLRVRSVSGDPELCTELEAAQARADAGAPP